MLAKRASQATASFWLITQKGIVGERCIVGELSVVSQSSHFEIIRTSLKRKPLDHLVY